MTSAQSLFLGLCLVAASLICVTNIRSATAYAGGPYQLMQHSNTSANVGVFRLDTNSGDVSYCYLNGVQSELVCTKPVR